VTLSEAVHVTGFEPVHVPLWHVSVCVQALPSLQAVPFVLFVHAVVLTAGWQDWHALLGLDAPGVWNAPPMRHPPMHCIVALFLFGPGGAGRPGPGSTANP